MEMDGRRMDDEHGVAFQKANDKIVCQIKYSEDGVARMNLL